MTDDRARLVIGPLPKTLDEMLADRVGAILLEQLQVALRGRLGVERTHYSVAEAAEAIGCSEGHLYRMLDDGVLPAVRLGTKRLINVQVLRDFGNPNTTAVMPPESPPATQG